MVSISQIDLVGGSRHYDESVPICPVESQMGIERKCLHVYAHYYIPTY